MAESRQKVLSPSTRARADRASITQTFVDRIKLPDPSGQARTVWDSKLKGFGVRVSGTKATASYICQRDVKGAGINRRFTLGRVGVMPLEDARERARALIDQMAAGIDPKAQAAADAAKRMTLGELFDEYLRRHPRLAKNTVTGYRNYFDRHLDHWRDRDIREISKSEVLDLRDRIVARVRTEKGRPRSPSGQGDTVGLTVADYGVTMLGTLFNFALDYDLGGVSENPAKLPRGTRFKPKPRTRVLSEDEYAPLYAAIQDLATLVYRDYLTLVLFSGCRREELASLSWSEVNLTDQARSGLPARCFRLTADRTKGAKERLVPLSDLMLDRLIALRRLGLSDTWVFASPVNTARGYIGDANAPLKAAAEAAGIAPLSLHDLRRSYTSIAAQHVSYPATLALTGHAGDSRDVTLTHYIHLQINDLRNPQQTITDELKRLCEINDTAAEAENVTRLKEAITHE